MKVKALVSDNGEFYLLDDGNLFEIECGEGPIEQAVSTHFSKMLNVEGVFFIQSEYLNHELVLTFLVECAKRENEPWRAAADTQSDVVALAEKFYQNFSPFAHLQVAGIVVNERDEFLLVKADRYTFPAGKVKGIAGSTWEILEKNLYARIGEIAGIDVKDGAIPFTDQAFITGDGHEQITQFFICRAESDKIENKMPSKYSEVCWMAFDDFDVTKFDELSYIVFAKAYEFIHKLNN